MKKLFLVCCILILVSPLLHSQEYIMNNNIPYPDAYVSTQITTLTGGTMDDGYFDLALPATHQFYFYGKKVTHIRIHTNGYVTFGFGSAPTVPTFVTNQDMPSLSAPDGYAAPWWDDWDLRTTGELWYLLGDSGVNKWVVVEWRDVPHYGAPGTAVSFQFFATAYMEWSGFDITNRANTIMFNYIDTDAGDPNYDFGASGTVGIEHYAGVQCEKYSFNEAVLNDTLAILFTPFVPIYDTTMDMSMVDSGQTTPDYVVFRPSDGVWYAHNYGADTTETPIQWGTRGDVALPGDFDGDGDADEMVYRPSNSTFYSWDPSFAITWGTAGDIPMVADFNNDGVSDIAVFRPSDGTWYIQYRPSGSTTAIRWGTQGDIPLPADYDGDGTADLAVYRPSDNVWYIRRSSNPGSPWGIYWGTEGDIPLPINEYSWLACDIAVFRPSSGIWYTYYPQNGFTQAFRWGTDGDQPVPANFTQGTDPSDLMVFRPWEGNWYSYNWLSGQYTEVFWGTLGDKPRCRWTFNLVAPLPSTGPDTR